MKIGDKDMKSNKGQALVEFVIILPITLILIFCVIDFGRVISLKSDLESKTNDITTFFQNGKTLEEINTMMDNKDVKVSIKVNGDYATITVSKKIKPITPGLSYIVDKVFDVETSRVIRNE